MNIISDKENIRIDKYLSELDSVDLTRAKIQKLIKTNNITVNGKEVKESYKICLNDNIEINVVEESSKLEGEDIPLDIVYEDGDILVINKPAHLLTISTDNEKERTLFHKVYLYCNKKNQKVFIVHRLDKDTSGIVVFAKDIKTKSYMQENWDKFKRGYVAVVNGNINNKKGVLKNYLN